MINKITRYHRVVSNALFRRGHDLPYDRIVQAITRLADACAETEAETEEWCYIDEGTEAYVDDILVGAYWHFTEWHGGQWSPEYAALCAIGRAFSPGMSAGPEDGTSEHEVYMMLDELAAKDRQPIPQSDTAQR